MIPTITQLLSAGAAKLVASVYLKFKKKGVSAKVSLSVTQEVGTGAPSTPETDSWSGVHPVISLMDSEGSYPLTTQSTCKTLNEENGFYRSKPYRRSSPKGSKNKIVRLLVGVAAVVVVRAYMRGDLSRERLRYFASVVIDRLKKKPASDPNVIRTTFTDLGWTQFKPVEGHTHGLAAADRSAASSFITRLGQNVGLEPVMYQKSSGDIRNYREGSRSYYWMKDVPVPPAPLVLPAKPLVALVDVDQYLDMPSQLMKWSCPTIVYTFQPQQVARVAENYSYTFDDKNIVHYRVTGGAEYVHEVWNYSVDNLVVRRTLFGIPVYTATFLIDRRATSPDHELIMLTPTGTWGVLGSIVAMCLGGPTLQRLRPAQRGCLRLQLHSKAGVMVSTGRPMAYASATVPATVDETIAAIARTSKYDLTMPQVISLLEEKDQTVARVAGATLLEYHRAKVAVKPDVVCPVPEAVRRYQFGNDYQPDAKPSLVAFMSPLLHGAFAPDETKQNEDRCVQGRIIEVQAAELPMTPLLTRIIDEFLQFLIPDEKKHSLDPVDMDEVMDRQNRPSQRRILEQAAAMLPARHGEMFMKKEPYGGVKDPRAITIINGVDKRDYSMFTYAFESVLKGTAWYAFGRTPKEVAARVTNVCETAEENVGKSDFDKFDGRGSNVMRELERRAYIRAFKPCHHDRVVELHRSQYGLRCYGRLGTKYKTEYQRLSGSPETAIMNSLTNGFVGYLQFRITKTRMGYHEPQEAYDKLGIYGGDDGLTPDVDVKSYERAASMIGQKIKIEPVKRGGMYVVFLARVYGPDVWSGDTNSVCDLPRQLSKFHVTTKLPSNVSPTIKMLEKVRSYSLSDGKTPIIGHFCAAVRNIYGGDIKYDAKAERVTTWLGQFDRDVQYPNELAEWTAEYAEAALPDFDMKRFISWIDTVNTYDKALNPPTFQDQPAAVVRHAAVVDGEIVLPAPPQEQKVELKDNKEEKDGKASDAKAPPQESKRPAVSPDERKKRFEETKARKMREGTWSDLPPPKRGRPQQQQQNQMRPQRQPPPAAGRGSSRSNWRAREPPVGGRR